MRAVMIPLLVFMILPVDFMVATSARGQTGAQQQRRVSAVDKSNIQSVITEFDRLRKEGNDALYNLDYQMARKRYQKMTELMPGHPAGYIYLANNLLLETLNSSRRLSSSLYSSASFYAQDADQDKVDPERDRQFNELIQKALDVVEEQLQKNPQDPESLYYKGTAFGLRTLYSITIKRSFGGAIGSGKKAIQHQKEVLKHDPNFIDAYLSIGLYEYLVDSLPLLWRLLARLTGVKGSKKEGIKHLEEVADRGKYSSDDARVLLIGIYSREDQPELALKLLSYLANKYPRNYLFGVERAAMLYRVGRGAEGERVFTDLLKDPHIAGAADVVNYQWGEALTAAGNYATAIERYKAVMDWPKSERSSVSLAHLRAGQAFDALGKRAEALAQYQLVLSLQNVYDSHNRAKRYQKKPYIPGSR